MKLNFNPNPSSEEKDSDELIVNPLKVDLFKDGLNQTDVLANIYSESQQKTPDLGSELSKASQ
jgi:hypothetical protein